MIIRNKLLWVTKNSFNHLLTCQASVSCGFPDSIQSPGSGASDMITERSSQRGSHWVVVIHNAERKPWRPQYIKYIPLRSGLSSKGILGLVISWIFSHYLAESLSSNRSPPFKIQALQLLLQAQGKLNDCRQPIGKLPNSGLLAATSGKAYQWADDDTLIQIWSFHTGNSYRSSASWFNKMKHTGLMHSDKLIFKGNKPWLNWHFRWFSFSRDSNYLFFKKQQQQHLFSDIP